MSVVENLFLNRQPSRAGLVDQRSALQRAVELARGIGLPLEDIDLTAPIKLLQPAQQQMICILRALIGDLKLLILDEPTSRLSETETEHLFDRIKLLRSQGISILYISHRLAEVRRIADTVTVLRDGRVSLQLEAGAQFDERQIVEAMTGQELDEIYPDRDRRHGATPGGPVLEVRDLSVVRGAVGHVALAPTSFEVSAGEVLGVFGVVGSGTSALAQALCGASPDRVGGTVSVNGRPLRRKSTADAVKHGLGYISGDPTEGTFAALSVEENLGLLDRPRDGASVVPLIQPVRRARVAQQLAVQVAVRCQGLDQPTGSLSGGNRQKVALARWLPTRPKVLVMEDPTRGIDVKARRDVYRSLEAMVRDGMAIVLISSDLDEVLGLADRGLVLRQGAVVDAWTRGEVTSKRVLHAALTAEQRAQRTEANQ
jgi:ribose transport system ATP-binding protein